MIALPLLLALLAPATPASGGVRAAADAAPEPQAASIVALARAIAADAAALVPPSTTRLALEVESPARRLATSFEAALGVALREAGFAPAVPVGDAAAAEASGADALVRVRVDLLGATLAAAGELRTLRPNFFTGEALAAGGPLAAELPADASARLLAGPGAMGPLAIEVVPFAALAQAPVALAVGTLGGTPYVAALLEDELVLLGADGSRRARHPLPPPAPGALPSRDPRAGLVVVSDSIRYAFPSRGVAGAVRLEGDALVHVTDAPPDVLPLVSGPAGVLSAMQAPQSNLFAPTLLLADAASGAAPRAAATPAPFVTALSAPSGGALPFGLVTGSGVFISVQADLTFGTAPVEGLGDAAALADLDGDGVAELLASGRTAAAPDAIRAIRLGAGGGSPIESAPIDAVLVIAASGDLGGGDEAIFAATDGRLLRVRRAP